MILANEESKSFLADLAVVFCVHIDRRGLLFAANRAIFAQLRFTVKDTRG